MNSAAQRQAIVRESSLVNRCCVMCCAHTARAEEVFTDGNGQGGSNMLVFWGSLKSNWTGDGPSERGIL